MLALHRLMLTPPMFGIAAGLAIVVFGLQPVVFNPNLPFYYLMSASAAERSLPPSRGKYTD